VPGAHTRVRTGWLARSMAATMIALVAFLLLCGPPAVTLHPAAAISTTAVVGDSGQFQTPEGPQKGADRAGGPARTREKDGGRPGDTRVRTFRSVPALARWEANLRGHNQTRPPKLFGPEYYAFLFSSAITLGFLDGDNHYDPINVFYEGRDYAMARRAAGDRSWSAAPFDAAIAAAVRQYRDLYVVSAAGRAAGHHAFNAGLARHYAETGDPASRDAALLVSVMGAGSNDGTPLWYGDSANGSREVAFSILLRLNAEDLGQAHRKRTDEFAASAMGHIDQWTASERKKGIYIQPFMVGLTCEALIAYWDRYRAPAIPPKIKKALDWLRANAWSSSGGGNPGTGTFYYNIDTGVKRTPAPDLSLLIAPAYAWYYQYSGDSTYRRWGDEAWAGSAGASGIGSQKVYNQSFRWSRRFLDWRDQGDARWPAATALTLAAPVPASDRANALSTPFRVALAGVRQSLARPVTVTPVDEGAGGTFLPASVRLTTDKPWAIFRYRPPASVTGPVTLSVTNDMALATPSPVAYTVGEAAPTATGYKLTGPTSGVVGRPATFTVSLIPDGAVPPATADAAGGLLVAVLYDAAPSGTFRPNAGGAEVGQAWLSADRPSMTVTYTPRTIGPREIRAKGITGLANPPGVAFTATEAVPDPSYHPRSGDRAVVFIANGPGVVPVLRDAAAYRVHAESPTTPDGRARLEALRRAGTFQLVPCGGGVVILRFHDGHPGPLAVEVRFTDGPLEGQTGLVPLPYVTRLVGDAATVPARP
jgi:hypothetical protein